MGKTYEEYTNATAGLDQFGLVVCNLIEEILVQNSIQYQYVTFRVKTQTSAHRKMLNGRDKYNEFNDLTDLLGVRVITYFPTDVDKAASAIGKEFLIDKKNSIDKRKLLETDRFGYLSLHYIASLTKKRALLPEYVRFKNMRFELQIRSVLQHAWAEIEHDLGYKLEAELPDTVKRDFSRLAGLLELADEEFERIRSELGDYEKQVEATLKTAPQRLDLNQSSIFTALSSESLLLELDKAIALESKLSLSETPEKGYASREASELKKLGVADLGELLALVKKYKKHIIVFAKYWLTPESSFAKNQRPLPRGIGLFYLEYILVAQKKDDEIKEWGKVFNQRAKVIAEVRETWEKVIQEIVE